MGTPGVRGNSPRNASAALKRARAVELRAMRKTFQQIADSLFPCEHHAHPDMAPLRAQCHATGNGCAPLYRDRGAAYRAVRDGLAEAYKVGEAERTALTREQLATADLALQRMLLDVLGAKDPGDRARAAGVVVRLLERVARLTGTDAPTRLQVTDELDDALSAALQELSETPAPTPAQLEETP